MAEKTEAWHSFSKKKKRYYSVYFCFIVLFVDHKVHMSRKIPKQNSLIYFCKGEE